MAKPLKTVAVGDGIQLQFFPSRVVAISYIDANEKINRILTNPETIRRIAAETAEFKEPRRGA